MARCPVDDPYGEGLTTAGRSAHHPWRTAYPPARSGTVAYTNGCDPGGETRQRTIRWVLPRGRAARRAWLTEGVPNGTPKGTSMPLPQAPSDVVARLRTAGCVFAEDEARLLVAEATSPDELATMLDRRIAGLPLEHVLGWAEFRGMRIVVDPDVFVPRRRTEFLAEQAIRLAGAITGRAPVVLDLCCGSGAVGAAMMGTLRHVELHAADIHPASVRCARRNISTGHVYEGDLFEPLPDTLRARVDVLVANVPYVPTEAIGMMPPEAREYEPRVALDGGMDGLDVLRRVAAAAPEWLMRDGHLLIEVSENQAAAVAATMTRAGLDPEVHQSDDHDATIIIATAPGAGASPS